ncbi:MAG: gamma-glutamylcyclotransferase [Hyphomicrobiaceae bacterium]|nr:gamma-glutamylcyclotransferase [Hyphomicrobiaceae bacterium]
MSDLWVFGYGSLMWRPGFEHTEQQPALLRGAHRSLCVYSVVHRGTEQNPGLVLGLDAGGSCRGIAFRVRRQDAKDTLDYLRGREQVTNVYKETHRQIEILGASPCKVEAVCFIVDRSHPQYAGRLPVERQAEIVRKSEGASGHNVEYVVNTLTHIHEMGLQEPTLSELVASLNRDSTPMPFGLSSPTRA